MSRYRTQATEWGTDLERIGRVGHAQPNREAAEWGTDLEKSAEWGTDLERIRPIGAPI